MKKVLEKVMFTNIADGEQKPTKAQYLDNSLITNDMMAMKGYIILVAITSHASGYMMRVATLHSPFSASEAHTCKKVSSWFWEPIVKQ